MTWTTLTPPPKTVSAPAAPVRIGLSKNTGSKKRAKMTIVVETDVLEKLVPSARFAGAYTVQLGSAKESHQLRIVAEEAGLFEPQPIQPRKSHAVRFVRFRLPSVERFPTRRSRSWPASTRLSATRSPSICRAGLGG